VAGGPVAVDPDVRPPPPVRVEVAFRILPDAPGHGGPGLAANQLADLGRAHGSAAGVPDVDVHAEGRTAKRGWLEVGDRQRRQEARPDLRAARDVDDRAPSAADLVKE